MRGYRGSYDFFRVLMTGRTIDAHETLRIGLVNRVVLAENLLEETVALAKSITEKAPRTVAGANRIARGEDIVSIFDGLEPARKAWNSADVAEGGRAYLEKRPPVSKGE